MSAASGASVLSAMICWHCSVRSPSKICVELSRLSDFPCLRTVAVLLCHMHGRPSGGGEAPTSRRSGFKVDVVELASSAEEETAAARLLHTEGINGPSRLRLGSRHHCCGRDAGTPMPSHPSSSSTSSDWTQAMLVCSTSAGSAPSIHPWPSQPWSLVCTTSSALCVPNHVSPSRRPCGNRNKPFAPIAAGLVYVGELLWRSSPSLYHRLISTSATRHLAERARVVLLQVHLSERSRLYT